MFGKFKDMLQGVRHKQEVVALTEQLHERSEALSKCNCTLQTTKKRLEAMEATVKNSGLLSLTEIQARLVEQTDVLNKLNEEVAETEKILTNAKEQAARQKREALKKLQADHEERMVQMRRDLDNQQVKVMATHTNERNKIAAELISLRAELTDTKRRLVDAQEQELLESFSLYEPHFSFTNSAEYKERLDEIRAIQKESVKSISATVDSWESGGAELTKAQFKRLRKDILKLSMRAFNSECDNCIDNVKFNNIDRMETRIRKAFDTCNKLLETCDVFWKEGVLERKLDELRLAHEFQVKRQQEKEEARQAREEQREQEKMEREIREARAKIEKERKHFRAALASLHTRLASASEEDKADIQARIDELNTQNSKLDEEERVLDYREQNSRAGYVYVISNIGAFGENIFKIGMTRRLEPMDRVDELGDASVPFRFDVHAMVFSDNAPALEAKLHNHFAAGRLNKVNGRKEFFRADIKAIESVIRANYDKVVEVVHIPPAQQYRESLLLTLPREAMVAV